jgi:hypothetical protein
MFYNVLPEDPGHRGTRDRGSLPLSLRSIQCPRNCARGSWSSSRIRVEAALAVYPSKLFPRGTLPQGGIEEERPSWSTLFLLLSPPGEDTRNPCPCILRGTIPKTSCNPGRAGRNLASPGERRIRTLRHPNTCGPGTPEDPGPRSGGVKAALPYPNLVPPRNPASRGNRGRTAFLVYALPLLFFHTHFLDSCVLGYADSGAGRGYVFTPLRPRALSLRRALPTSSRTSTCACHGYASAGCPRRSRAWMHPRPI